MSPLEPVKPPNIGLKGKLYKWSIHGLNPLPKLNTLINLQNIVREVLQKGPTKTPNQAPKWRAA
jgi:hypothetical protein